MRFFWRLFLAGALFAALIPAARAQQLDVQVSGASYYVTLANNLAWNQLSANYIFTPQSPNEGVCLFVENLNTTSSHAITVTAFQNGDPQLASYAAEKNLWQASQTSGIVSTVPANSTRSEYINATGSAHLVIVLSGTATAGGTPDTANVFAVQTSAQNCGSSPAAVFVQGDVANGASAAGIDPVYICGNSLLTNFCRSIEVDGNGNIINSLVNAPGDGNSSLQFEFGSANDNGTASGPFVTSPQLWTSGGGAVYQRSIDTFNSAAASASGNTTVWTEAAGHFFRLMCISIDVTENATQTTAGELTITLQDGTTTIPGFLWEVFVPSTALTTAGALYSSGNVCFSDGYESIAAPNSLSVNLSAALLTGAVVVRAWGNNH